MQSLRAASASWHDFAEDGYDVAQEVVLVAFVRWLQRPAVLRTLRAHSNGSFAGFARTDPEALASLIGTPWSWRVDRRTATPSLAAACGAGHADFFLYRTLWQHHALPDVPYLMIHTGCEAVSPPGSPTLPYDAPGYGRGQQAEALLFYTPCLALVGRAKVFYDEPGEFSATLERGGTYGAAWQRYFAVEADSSWGEAGGDIGRKRSYFWSLYQIRGHHDLIVRKILYVIASGSRPWSESPVGVVPLAETDDQAFLVALQETALLQWRCRQDLQAEASSVLLPLPF